MKKILIIIATAGLLFACDKTKNEQDIFSVFFDETAQTGGNETQALINIKDIEFANASNTAMLANWGDALYASQMRYLQMRILYDCNTNEQQSVTLFVKIINPNGTLRQNTDSPDNYTMNKTFTSAGIKKKDVYQELGGWGNASQSTYTTGTYKVELWEEYESVKKIFETTVQLR